MPDADVIIIGSGPAGVHAAETLVHGGASVLMLDGGNRPSDASNPLTDFVGLRTDRVDQWRWFLGDDLSGIPTSGLTGGLGGGQVSGNRGYVVRDADHELPLRLRNAQVIQSLAAGGLGAAWGATCAYLTADELDTMGLPSDAMESAYDEVTQSIGISGPQIRPEIDPPLALDHHAVAVMGRYGKRKAWFDRQRFRVVQPHAAVLTRDRSDRKATDYADLDYFADEGRSVYRPQYALESLLSSPLFRYEAGVVTTFEETSDEVRVMTHPIGRSSDERSFLARHVLLAAGAVGTARILLRSLGMTGVRVPFVGKHHVFSACIDLNTFGHAGSRKRTSLCQLLVLDDELRHGLNAGIAQLYSYRSLQLFRLLSSVPMATPYALRALSIVSPALVIADIRFPAFPSHLSTLALDIDDRVTIEAGVSDDEKALRMRSWKRLRKAFRRLGIPALKNLWLPEASSSHYAGTVPSSDDPSLPLSCDIDGRVHQCSRVSVADASMFRCLPAKPHTLTIMANARRVASTLLKNLR